jgi:hypothetical protein
MRLSYTRKLGPQTDAVLRQLADAHGFQFEDGEVFATVPVPELLAGAMALAQIEAAAEAAVAASVSRRISSERFKKLVRDVLEEAFKESVEFGFHSAQDPDALYPVDALLRTPRWLAVSFVPSDVEAERAVATYHAVHPVLDQMADRPPRWVTIPRDISSFREGTRKRLMSTHHVAAPVFDEAAVPLIRAKLTDLGDVRH